MQCARIAFRNYIRKFSHKHCYVLEQLPNRSLLRLCGEDADALLQGIITNDITHLSNGPGSMYAMFLNSKGRVLYDTIVYRTSNDNLYYVEVDKQVADVVQKHLNAYRLRRKVDVSRVDDELKIWVYFNAAWINLQTPIEPPIAKETTNEVSRKLYKDGELLVFQDPRLASLGSRIIAPVDGDLSVVELFPGVEEPTYKKLRYRLGVGEGVDNLPPGNCFPLEANADLLHGVSFQKGCYLGQELTARSHHTGVIRKRLMPLILNEPFKNIPAKDETIKSGEENIGKLRGYEHDCALALLRFEKALNADKIIISDTEVRPVRPTWWPRELPTRK